jgi:hypothetical protein
VRAEPDADTVNLVRRDPEKRLRLGRALVTALIGAFLLALNSSGAWARAYLPPPGKLFQGETGAPAAVYERAVGKHPAVVQVFSAWGEYLPGIFATAAGAHSRLMIHVTTGSGPREVITPRAIADGQGDQWLLALGRAIAASGHPVYIRLMAEMNAYWNFYSAFNSDGSSRGDAHSTAAFRRAWKRVTLIMRGGALAHINPVLARLGMPALRTTHDLPAGRVAMLWVPQVAGAPDVPGNRPRAYWPGRAWVDWVGTDFYSKFPNFTGLNSFYAAFGGKPFVFGEYALWGADDPGFVQRLFSWVGGHRRTRMLVYNEGMTAGGPFRLTRYPQAARALRKALASTRYPSFSADW